MATIALEVVILAVTLKSLKVLLYRGCWKMLEAAVAKLANMQQTIRTLLWVDIRTPAKKIYFTKVEVLNLIMFFDY